MNPKWRKARIWKELILLKSTKTIFPAFHLVDPEIWKAVLIISRIQRIWKTKNIRKV